MGLAAVWLHLSEASLLKPGWKKKKNPREEAQPQAKHSHTAKVKRGSGEKQILKGHPQSRARTWRREGGLVVGGHKAGAPLANPPKCCLSKAF